MSRSQGQNDESDDNLSLYLTPSQDHLPPSENEGQPGEGQDGGHNEGETPPGSDSEEPQPYKCSYNFIDIMSRKLRNIYFDFSSRNKTPINCSNYIS